MEWKDRLHSDEHIGERGGRGNSHSYVHRGAYTTVGHQTEISKVPSGASSEEIIAELFLGGC